MKFYAEVTQYIMKCDIDERIMDSFKFNSAF